MTQNLSNAFFPGKKFVKDTYGQSQKWFPNNTKIISRAIVLEILYDVDTTGSEPFSPPYSIKAKIIGEDISSEKIEFNESKWYPPFFPVHMISLPEIGEEILVLREFDNKSSFAFWIGRVNDSSSMAKLLVRSYSSSSDVFDKYQMLFDVKQLKDSQEEPSSEKNFSIPARPGDVIMQGRSNTFIRHSFAAGNKNGILELGIKENRKYTLGANSIGTLKTKTLHVTDVRLRDISTINVNEKIDSMSGYDTILNVAERLVNIATKSNNELEQHVLGNTLNEFIIEIIDYITRMNTTVLDLYDQLINHNHVLPSQDVEASLPVMTPGGPRVLKTMITVKSGVSRKTQILTFPKDIKESIQRLTDSMNKMVEENIDKHLSKNQLLN